MLPCESFALLAIPERPGVHPIWGDTPCDDKRAGDGVAGFGQREGGAVDARTGGLHIVDEQHALRCRVDGDICWGRRKMLHQQRVREQGPPSEEMIRRKGL